MSEVTRPAAAVISLVARIYTLADPRTCEIRYVGMTTKTLAVRLKGHMRNDHEKNHRAAWIGSLKALGLKPLMAELEVVQLECRAEAEQRWIKFYREQGARLVNATDGGEGTVGFKMSDDTRRRISEAKIGKPQPNNPGKRGQRLSEETKELLRRATIRQFSDPAAREAVSRVHRGKVISEEHARIVSEATRKRWDEWRASGSTVSDETRARISAAAKARPPRVLTPETRAKLAESKRQWWAARRATGEDATASTG